MWRRISIRQTALLITFVYLFLSSAIMVGAEGHALRHGHAAHHAAQHASFICAWMCAASSFIHSDDPNLGGSPARSSEDLKTPVESLAGPRVVGPLYIRPPPISSP